MNNNMIIFFCCFILSFLLNFLSYFLGLKEANYEKSSIYECGFNPITKTGKYFNMKYFIMGVMFLMFDLEIMYLFPFGILSNDLNYIATLFMFMFMFILLLGYFMDWKNGGLEWE